MPGTEPLLVGRVGDDERGQTAARRAARGRRGGCAGGRPGAPDRHVHRARGTPTASARWLRTPVRTTASPRPTCPTSCSRPRAHLHVAGYALLRSGSRPAARAAISRALERGLSVSVDPSSAALLSPEFLDHAHGAGLLLPNAEEAQMLSGERDPERAARALAARFSEVVVTLGADGALWTDGRRSVHCDAVAGGGRGGQHRRGRRVRRGAAGGASGGCGARGGAGGGGAAGR